MKTVGIIGGLGPETTAEFYLELIFQSFEKNASARPPMLIWNVPLPYDIEKTMLEEASGIEHYVPFLIDAAVRLEAAGADFLVMPCNTLHVFIPELRKAVTIPILSIIEETVWFLGEKKIQRVGLLATPQLLKDSLYKDALSQSGIEIVLPHSFDQAKIGKMINRIVRNRHSNGDHVELQRIVEGFTEHNVEDVILACTDLQLLLPQHEKLRIFDTMSIFADATVSEILS